MPINKSLMSSLQKEYGKEKGKQVYYGMEAKGDKSTKPAAIKKSLDKKKTKNG